MKEHFPFEEAKRMMFSPLRTGSLLWRMVAVVLAMLVTRHFLSDS